MEKGRVRVGMTMMGSFMNASHSVEPEQREPGLPDDQQPSEHILDISMMQWDLEAQVGLHKRFAIELSMPVRTTVIDATFEDQAGAEIPGFTSIHHRDETIAGVGDFAFGGRVGLVLPDDVERWTLALRAGITLPTGGIEPDPFVLGEDGHEHQHMFFGSGTIDPVVGLDSKLAFDKWALTAWTLAKLPLYANQFGYRGSRVVVGGAGAQSGFGLERWSFLLQPEFYFETPAQWSGMSARNSGRTNLVATAGVFFRPGDQWQIHAIAKVPYLTQAQGGQLRWPFVGLLGFSYVFDAWKPKAEPEPAHHEHGDGHDH